MLSSSSLTAPPVSASVNREWATVPTSGGLPRGGEGGGHDGFQLSIRRCGQLARENGQGWPGKLRAGHVDEGEVHRVSGLEQIGTDVRAHEHVRPRACRCDDGLVVCSGGHGESVVVAFLAGRSDRRGGKFLAEPAREARKRRCVWEVPDPAPAASARRRVDGGEGEGGFLVG